MLSGIVVKILSIISIDVIEGIENLKLNA